MMPVDVVPLPHYEGLPLPSYATEGAACFDFLAAVREPLILAPHGQERSRALVPTGLKMAIPHRHELQIRSRSGIPLRHAVIVGNSPGTIDEDYRGEIGIILINLDPWEPFPIERGMRIAQGLLAPVVRATWVVRSGLTETARGEGGFGHTGMDGV